MRHTSGDKMKRYRAIRKPGEIKWMIEVFDAEFQVAYDYKYYDDESPRDFLTKSSAEHWIQNVILPNPMDQGEKGEWFDDEPV